MSSDADTVGPQARQTRATAFPFSSLERITRAELAHERSVLRAVLGTFSPEVALATFTDRLGEPLSATVRRFPHRLPPWPALAEVAIDGVGLRCRVATESALVTQALAPLLGVASHQDDPTVPLDPVLQGGFHALVLDLAKRACTQGNPRVVFPAPSSPPLQLSYELTLRGPRTSYGVILSFSVPAGWLGRENRAPTPEPTSQATVRARLARLGEIRLGLPLFAGAARSTLSELAGVEIGDVWLPGEGFWLDRQLTGTAVLVAPRSRLGTQVDLRDGKIVVSRRSQRFATSPHRASPPRVPPQDSTARPASSSPMSSPMSDSASAPDEHAAPGESALDAEVEVRIELGQVTMTAKDWSVLRPGDIVETNRPIGECVRLYAGGVAVAHGELVDVEGRVGVRITGLGE